MLKQQKIMILGAGVYQEPLIRAALSMNLEVHVASVLGDYPGINIVSNFHPIDITDEKAILELCQELDIDGILTTATDICVPTIGFVVDNIGLRGTGYKSGYACMDKSIMKYQFMEKGVPTANYRDIKTVDEAVNFFEEMNGPCVIKATDSSGSRGIIRVNRIHEITDAFNEAFSISKNGTVLIEEWITGDEFGAQAVVIGDELILTMIHSDITTPPPRKMPIGHGCPHPEENRLLEKTKIAIQDAVKALEIKDAICNVDLIDSPNGPILIEIAARMGGTCLPEVCGNYWGIDMYQLAINIALGQEVELPITPSGKPTFAHVLFSEKGGVFISPGEMKEGLDWKIDVQEGELVRRFSGGNDRFGHVIGTSDNILEIESKIEQAVTDFVNSTKVRNI